MNYNRRREYEKKRQHKMALIGIIVALLVIVPVVLVACNVIKGCSAKIKDNRDQSSVIEQSVEESAGLVPGGPSSEDDSVIEPESSRTEPSSTPESSEPESSEPSSQPDDLNDSKTLQEKISKYVSSEKSETLRLVNKVNVLPEDFEPDITELRGGKNFSVIAAAKLDEMINDCNKACGGKLWAQSTYRSYAKQSRLYDKEVKRWLDKGYGQSKAEKTAATIVAPPGTSEHNTGLACDFNTVTEAFAKTDMYPWLIKHCAEYGFIERFPKDKQDITGIIWEPWHYRYVGIEAATEIMDNGWCLEEYHYYKGL